MKRAKLWSALVLATMATGTGCGSLPTMDTIASKHGPPPPGAAPSDSAAGTAQSASATALSTGPSIGFNFLQLNYLGDATAGDNSSVSAQQVNRAVTVVLDEPKDLLKHYIEVPGLVWDRTTHGFHLAQGNWTGAGTTHDGSHAAYRQLNNLIIIVDPHAQVYSGIIEQGNGLGSVTTGSDSQVTIAQINNVTVIHSGEEAPDAEDYVASLNLTLEGPTGDATAVVNQVHDWLIYIDGLGRPHLYRWQAPVGKNGLAFDHHQG